MPRLLAVAVSLFLTLVAAHASAAALKTPEDVRKVGDALMGNVVALNMDRLAGQLKEYSFIPPSEVDSLIGRIKLQLPMVTQRYGNSLGYEFIREERVGNSLVRLTYIQRLDRNALPWHFIFYLSPSGWTVNGFFFVDNPNTLFDGQH